jgi:hypothetical protein
MTKIPWSDKRIPQNMTLFYQKSSSYDILNEECHTHIGCPTGKYALPMDFVALAPCDFCGEWSM